MSVVQFLLLLAGLIGSALYSGLETGVVSANRVRVRHLVKRKWRGAQTLQYFIENPNHLLGTTLAGTNLCNVMISVTAASLAARWWGGGGVALAGFAVTLLLLVFGEYLPKAWFRGYPSYRVLPWAGFLRFSGYLFYPVSWVVMQLARLLLRGASDPSGEGRFLITREELAHLARESTRSGALTEVEQRMIKGVLDLRAKTCGDLMVPRSRMVMVQPDTPAVEALQIARDHRVSRLPIYNEQEQQFCGVVHVLDIARCPAAHRGQVYARDFSRPPQYVVATEEADRLLPRMRFSRQPLALVRDRAGDRVIGLITSHDIVEAIVGVLSPG